MKSGASEAAATSRLGAAAYAAAFAVVALLLLPVFRDGLNPDGVSYLAIARKYLAGDLHAAVNAYWGPLYSWLLMPLLAAGVAPVLAAHLLNVFVGTLAAFALWRLAGALGSTGRTRLLTMGGALPLLLLAAHQSLSPDLLMTAVVLFYLVLLADAGCLGRGRCAVAIGALGGLAYWTKAYGFYFVLAHFLTIVAGDLLWGRWASRRRMVAFYARALAVFAVLSSLWIGALAWNCGRPMIASTGEYNRVLAAPGSRGHPMLYLGFLAPPDRLAVSAWDDPTRFDLRQMQAVATTGGAADRLGVVTGNLRRVVHFLAYFCAASCLVIAAWAGVGVWRRRGGGVPWRPLLVVGAAAAIYPLGYVMVLVTVRYLLFWALLLAVIAGALLPGLLTGRRRQLSAGGVVLTAASVALAAGIAVVPLRELKVAADPVPGASSRPSAEALSGLIRPGATLASNDRWEDSLYLAQRLGARYFGQRGDLPCSAVPAALARLRVDYYLVWGGAGADTTGLGAMPRVDADRVPGLSIYDVAGASSAGR